MMRIVILFFLITISLAVKGQVYNNAVHLGWNIVTPLSDKDFTGSTSVAGLRLGYTKFLSDRFGFGFEGGYSTLDDYIPPTTYEQPGGAITTDVYNYLYYFNFLVNGQYYLFQGERFTHYTSLGAGLAYSEYKIFYNVYQEKDHNTSFVMRPEIGTLFKFKEYSSFGLKAAIGFDYATNKSDYFETKNFAGLNIMFGIVLIND